MADAFSCSHCGRRWPSDDPAPPAACPDCGARLSAIYRDAPTATSQIPVETGSGVLAAGGGPSSSVDDALFVGERPPNDEDAGEFDSSLRTTIFDFPIQPPATFPELAVSAVAETSSPLPSSSVLSSIATPVVQAVGSSVSTVTSRVASGVRGPSPLALKIAISYASAVTLACIYLAYLLSQRTPTLDLPDLAPPAKSENRVTTLLYVPPDTVIHPAQKLRLGESRQYGALRITPLRVARGPLQFEFFNPVAGEARPPSAPVLKLYLRFENVSDSQEVVPLDRHLVYTKEPDRRNFGRFKANNFVCSEENRSEFERHVLVYDLSPESEWLVCDANHDRPLKPGDSVDSFVPTTEEGWKELSGRLVWRVHLRKGYNPTSLRGVTTLIEVTFNSSDIVDDEPSRGGTG
jgi:predicted RNA-binding Zn-ribbon protein involved in translation (DUF1610 family)